jgi:transcriptional regulator with XRE-family HTH domain
VQRDQRWTEAGAWLREVRERRGLSQRELAENVGVRYHSVISQLEAGRARIPQHQFKVWARALGIEHRLFSKHLATLYVPTADACADGWSIPQRSTFSH